MTDRLPRVADLMQLALQIEQRDPGNKLVEAVKNAGRVQSCIADLSMAETTLQALAQLAHAAFRLPDMHKAAADHGLLANAIMLYARATSTGAKAGERGHTSISDRLSAESKERHDRIVDVRNKALAHVRSNEPIGEDFWHREVVFAVEERDGTWLPAAAARRVQSNPTLANDLRQLLPEATLLLKDTYHRRLAYVSECLNATPGLAELMGENLTDPILIFGSERQAFEALSKRRPGGRVTGVIDV